MKKPSYEINDKPGLDWLCQFQKELIEDKNTFDGTRKPSFYTIAYDRERITSEEYGGELRIFQLDDHHSIGPDEYVAQNIKDDPHTWVEMAIENEAGLYIDDCAGHGECTYCDCDPYDWNTVKKNPDEIERIASHVKIEDIDDFCDWVNLHTDDQAAWVESEHCEHPDYFFLTRRAADNFLHHGYIYGEPRLRSYAHPVYKNPQLSQLISVLCRIDLDRSNIILKDESTE